MENQAKTGRTDSVAKVIHASPRALYQAFMDPNALIKWLPPTRMKGNVSLFEPKIGRRYQLSLTYENEHETVGKTTENSDVIEGTFKELIPDMKIVESGVFDSNDPAFSGEMTMTWYFEAVPEGTKVTIIAENVPPGINKQDHILGLSSTLENLEGFVEKK